MELNTTATFIGHSECYGITKEQIKVAIVKLIEKGVIDFLSGGQGGFDRMCAGCVKELKEEYPHISNILVISYLNFNVFNKDIFDLILYPEGFEKYHFKAAIPARNKYMVKNSGYPICYITHGWGGAAQTYERAKKNGLEIIDIGRKSNECSYV